MFQITTLFWFILKFTVIFAFLPLLLMFILASISFYLYSYKSIYGRKHENLQELWQKPIRRVAQFWYYHSRFYHGYEIHGLENIPDGPAVIIFYHSGMPIDIFYAGANIFLKKNRKIVPIIEKQMFKQIGIQSWLQAIEGTAGSVESCVETLKKGRLLAIAPGGVREMLFSDSTYNLIWGTGSGFAKIAIEAKVPIIPLFTQNSRGISYVPNLFTDFFKELYDRHKFGYIPFFGWFPVKLRTYIGKPIEYDPNRSVDQLVQLTKKSLEDLIKQHQRIPGSIFSGLLDRLFNKSDKNN